jgi:hypothetical protein
MFVFSRLFLFHLGFRLIEKLCKLWRPHPPKGHGSLWGVGDFFCTGVLVLVILFVIMFSLFRYPFGKIDVKPESIKQSCIWCFRNTPQFLPLGIALKSILTDVHFPSCFKFVLFVVNLFSYSVHPEVLVTSEWTVVVNDYLTGRALIPWVIDRLIDSTLASVTPNGCLETTISNTKS